MDPHNEILAATDAVTAANPALLEMLAVLTPNELRHYTDLSSALYDLDVDEISFIDFIEVDLPPVLATVRRVAILAHSTLSALESATAANRVLIWRLQLAANETAVAQQGFDTGAPDMLAAALANASAYLNGKEVSRA